jgi:hypothetical protein
MKLRTTACVFVPVILMLLTTIPVLGGVVPGRWEKVDSLEPGAGIVVSLGSGEKMSCFLQGTTPEAISIVSSDGKELELPKSAVTKIETLEKKRGPLWDGALIGGAIGLGVTGLMLARYGDSHTNNAAILAVWGGIGAGIGLAVDAGVAGRKTLYKAKTK